MKLVSTIFFGLLLSSKLFAQILVGPYAPPAGQSGTTAIHKDSSIIVGWASTCNTQLGWQNIADTTLGKANTGSNLSAIGQAGQNGVISLGDQGMATLTFNGIIQDGPGPDFAVFENSFDGAFLELAFVEVSSDGINFYRFDAHSLTDTIIQTNTFGITDATELYNLAGKYSTHHGTPFDLNELAGIAGLDINNVSHVRVIDVVGNIAEPYSSYDSQNRAVNDPWPTPFPSSGFDLDAIGVINFMSNSINDYNNSLAISSYPNPATDKVYFNIETSNNYTYRLTNINGNTLLNGKLTSQLDISHLDAGIYFIYVSSGNKLEVKKIIKQ